MGVCSMGVMRPDLVMKNVIPVVMAGILGIYGLIIGILIKQQSEFKRKVPNSHIYNQWES